MNLRSRLHALLRRDRIGDERRRGLENSDVLAGFLEGTVTGEEWCATLRKNGACRDSRPCDGCPATDDGEEVDEYPGDF